jgi:hypothetical protein
MKSKLNKTFIALLTFGALGLAASGAQAGWDHRGYGPGHAAHAHKQSQFFMQQINARQDRQMERIHAGMRQGNLTRGEFRRLMQEQHDIRAMERHFRADGFIDVREFQRLDRALDIASHNIRLEKHDRQDRYAHNRMPWHN